MSSLIYNYGKKQKSESDGILCLPNFVNIKISDTPNVFILKIFSNRNTRMLPVRTQPLWKRV